MTFDINVTELVGFEWPTQETYRAIAQEALSAATAAPDRFAVIERATSAPVSRATIIEGASRIVGQATTGLTATAPPDRRLGLGSPNSTQCRVEGSSPFETHDSRWTILLVLQ